MEPDYYRILGVKKDATEDEIKQSYRKVAKKHHPDANPGDKEAERKFKEAAEAFAVLGDTGKRKAYDKERLQAHGAGSEHKMSSDFEQFFGFRPGSGQVEEDKPNPNKKTKANPIDMTEMFERYMGIKK